MNEDSFYEEWMKNRKALLEKEKTATYIDSLAWKEKSSWKYILEEFKRSYVIALNYGEDNPDTIPVSGFCITDLIDISELEYKRGVPSDEEVKNVVVEFTSYEEKDGVFQINPEYKIYMPLIKLLNLIESGVASKNSENVHSKFGRDVYHEVVSSIISAIQNYIKLNSSKLKGVNIGEKSISLDDLDATYVRIDPETNESQALGSNYSVTLYSLGKVLRKTLVKTPSYNDEERSLGRTR